MIGDAIARIDEEMRAVISSVEASRPAVDVDAVPVAPLYGMMRYHLGWVDEGFAPAPGDGGKKLRGQLCLLASELVGGDAERALPLAAAVELLHNFTLVHDDIQDSSPVRRHRPTVWSRWGIAQAINVGDGLYALARLALFRLADQRVPPGILMPLAMRFEETLLAILEGQYLDLAFEQSWAVTVPAYLSMIEGKTARLVSFCLEAGGRVGGASPSEQEALAVCGLALGLGFQVRDDILGIWGRTETTGKPAAGDLLGRKKSLPVLIAMERATPSERRVVQEAYAVSTVAEEQVAAVLAVLDRTAARQAAQAWVERYHAEALASLEAVGQASPARQALADLLAQLVVREF